MLDDHGGLQERSAAKAWENHGHFQGRSAAVFATTLTFLVLSSVFVFLRMISRVTIVKRIAIDDYLMVLAWAITFGLSFCICYGCTWGLGRHESHVPSPWQGPLREADYAFAVLYQPALMATKSSILAFYLTLPTINKTFKWACVATLFVVNAGGLALSLVTIFQCSPIDAAWNVTTAISQGHCIDIVTIFLSSTPLNIITDLAILFLPIPILTGMRLPRKQKIILVITFSFGAFTVAVDVVRIVYLQGAAMTRLTETIKGIAHGKTLLVEQGDFSWYASQSFMWSAIEVNVGIMCACVPGLKPLVARFLPKMLRDAEDPPSHFNSVSKPVSDGRMQEIAHIPSLPSTPTDVHQRDNDGHVGGLIGLNEAADDGEMGLMDFLGTPRVDADATERTMSFEDFLKQTGPDELPRCERTQTALTNTSRDTKRETRSFFDFVDMRGKKSMLHMTTRESVFPIAVVTVLFFIWGFEYGLLDVLNQQFLIVAHGNGVQGTAIHGAYYAGYLFGPLLVGRLVLQHWGFKACFTVGLSIFGCGTLIFWAAAVLTSFPAFIITNFIVAFGLSILEVSANAFIILCGPPEHGEIRLNFSQGVQAVGSVVAPLIAAKAFVTQNFDGPSLIDTQWAYLGIALFTIFLAVAFYYIQLPEATDKELEEAAERSDGANTATIGNVRIIWITLAFGTFSQFCYVGAQEVNGAGYASYLHAIAPSYNETDYDAIAHTAFAVSRFLAAGLGFWIKPRILLLVFYLGAIVFEVLAMNFKGGTGIAMITMVFFFEGPLFSLIFAQSLRGKGRHTKIASVCLTSAVSGGAVFLPISYHIQSNGRAMYALVIAVAAFAAGTVFPIGLNGNRFARKQCDPVTDVTSLPQSRDGSSTSRTSRTFGFLPTSKKSRRDSANDEWKERGGSET